MDLNRVADAILGPSEHANLWQLPSHLPCAIRQALPLNAPKSTET
jgi:hypothetical protein